MDRLFVGAVAALALLAASAAPASAQRILGGKGAPQAEHCTSQGGTLDRERTNVCHMPDGSDCNAMTLFREGACVDPEASQEEQEEDFGTNDGSDGEGGEGGGDSGGGEGGGEG